MTICGIELTGSEARLVLIQGEKEDFSIINVEPRKIILKDDSDQDEVKAFKDSIFAFFRENKVTKVLIKMRSKKGDYVGGPVGFKLEGIIQLYDECPVILVTPQKISASKKRHNVYIPSELYQYQKIAFETAFAELP